VTLNLNQEETMMSEVNEVVIWDKLEIYVEHEYQSQEGRAVADAYGARLDPCECWRIVLSRRGEANDWWLRVHWSDYYCVYQDVNTVIHATGTGTPSLAEAHDIASAIVVALQLGRMDAMSPWFAFAHVDDEEDCRGGHHGWCLCDECTLPTEAELHEVGAIHEQATAMQVASLHTLGPEVCQQLGVAASRMRFLDCVDEVCGESA
jgi:hypothetical protein